ncbi:MAG: ROK family protein [Oscillospiraceae bacterium]
MYYLGVDLGGTNLVAGVVSQEYRLINKVSVKTPHNVSGDELCDAIALLCNLVLQEADIVWSDVHSVGIGVPGGANSIDGTVDYMVNLFMHNWPLKASMEQRLQKPVHIANDANAAAWGEFMAGSLVGTTNAIMITIGTGIGGGIIINKQIYQGCNYNGGEVGCMVIQVIDGTHCNCGRSGCWEQYASACALTRLTKKMMIDEKENAETLFSIAHGEIDKVNGKTAFDAMRAGDKLGTNIVKCYLEFLGCGIVNLVNIFQPDALCIGGGIGAEGEYLLAPLREILEKERISKYSTVQTHLCCAKLRNDAGIIGAATLHINL